MPVPNGCISEDGMSVFVSFARAFTATLVDDGGTSGCL